MKAVVETCVRADFGVKDIKITKPRIEDSEMSACFHKLKELVPSVPQHKRISKVALLQHVIDYILDLEITLEKHPAMASIPPPLASVCRSPLAEKSDLNNAQIEVTIYILLWLLMTAINTDTVCILFFYVSSRSGLLLILIFSYYILNTPVNWYARWINRSISEYTGWLSICFLM